MQEKAEGITSNIIFDVVCCEDMENFINFINRRLKDGWSLHGGIFMKGCKICQAIIKEKV